MFTEKAMKNADACRFCWMCRHLCPVGLKTGREVNTPRAKGLLISLDARGHKMDRDTAQIMYECTLCGSCTNDCATGFEPPVYIREARTQAVVEDMAPAKVMELIDRMLEKGTLYETAEAYEPETPSGMPVLLYLGDCARHIRPEIAKATGNLLTKAGVSYSVLADEPATGAALGDLMGYVSEVQEMAGACAQAINASGAKTVVVLDSYDLAFMLHRMPEWGITIQPEIVSAQAYIGRLVREGRLNPAKQDLVSTIHDATPDARDLPEDESVREILKAMGADVHEMFLNHRMAKCCGSGVFKCYAPELARLTAEGRWDDAHRQNMHTIVCANPQATDVLSGYAAEGDRAVNLFVLLDAACGE